MILLRPAVKRKVTKLSLPAALTPGAVPIPFGIITKQYLLMLAAQWQGSQPLLGMLLLRATSRPG
jgi:hypothetical protein